MSRMDQEKESDSLGKLLLIAENKLGKSHYAGMCAAAGFNVLYFDGDVGRQTLRTLPLEVRQRIYAIDCADTLLGGVKDSRMWDTIKEFTSSSTFVWNDSKDRIATSKDKGDVLWKIKPAKMDHTCVMVLDSWTSLSESMATAGAVAHSVDLSSATTSEMRPVYQVAGLKGTQVLQCFKSMRCHVIVLAHPDEYQHTTLKDGVVKGKAKETDQVVDWTKWIPRSTSKPHGMQMGKYFSDMAWMEATASGQRMLNFRLRESHVGGGHFDDRKSVDEYSFANLVKRLGGSLPGPAGAPIDSWMEITSVVAESADTSPALQAHDNESLHSPQVLDGRFLTEVVRPNVKNLFAKKV